MRGRGRSYHRSQAAIRANAQASARVRQHIANAPPRGPQPRSFDYMARRRREDEHCREWVAQALAEAARPPLADPGATLLGIDLGSIESFAMAFLIEPPTGNENPARILAAMAAHEGWQVDPAEIDRMAAYCDELVDVDAVPDYRGRGVVQLTGRQGQTLTELAESGFFAGGYSIGGIVSDFENFRGGSQGYLPEMRIPDPRRAESVIGATPATPADIAAAFARFDKIARDVQRRSAIIERVIDLDGPQPIADTGGLVDPGKSRSYDL